MGDVRKGLPAWRRVYAPTQSTLEGAIRTLTAKDPEKPWQRDGWLFQVISWIAANIQDPGTLKSPPHIIHADKGFDGLHLCLDASNENVVSVIVCEEKATDGPRGKITSQVWPEFQSLDAGARDNELVSETTTLLAQNGLGLLNSRIPSMYEVRGVKAKT
jgi:hypothetical protein